MTIQMVAFDAEFEMLGGLTVDDFELAHASAIGAFTQFPECAYVEFAFLSYSGEIGFELDRVELLTFAELETGI